MSEPSSPKVETALQHSFDKMWQMSESDLEIELGQRIQLTQVEQAQQLELSAAKPFEAVTDTTRLSGALDDFRQLGRNLVSRLEKSMYALVCDKNDPDNAAIIKLGLDPKTLGLMLAGYLTAHFAILPGIAIVLASLFAKRFVGTVYETACDEWQNRVAKLKTAP